MTKTSHCVVCKSDILFEPVPHPFREGSFLNYEPTICNRCSDLHEQVKQEKMKLKRQEEKEAAWLEFCPPLFHDTDPARLPQSQLTKVLAWNYQPIGLLLHGCTDKGKTRTAWLLVKKLWWEDVTIHEFSAMSFNRASADASGHFRSSEFVKALSSSRKKDLLFIDDLGKGKMTARAEQDLFEIFNTRLQQQKPVLVTTNYNGESLTKQFSAETGGPFVRRLKEITRTIGYI